MENCAIKMREKIPCCETVSARSRSERIGDKNYGRNLSAKIIGKQKRNH